MNRIVCGIPAANHILGDEQGLELQLNAVWWAAI